ncbi:hypothetical protein [Actinoplanes subglobosus]|uniref:Uncharacterized protein n=1 Tax=Actinoplanes subglobosus TaxID=1547892 RepID=A0ABV8IR34_9ACTN
MENARHELGRMRESPEAWRELRYEQTTGADGYDCDRNATRRATVLWALQYDRRPEDLALVRWLAEQEAVCRRKAPFQGLTETTELAGFLLAEYRQPEDVWLQFTIKRANFDTWCGYDREYLFAAGTDKTLDLVRSSTHPFRDEVLELSTVSDDDLPDWAAGKRSFFPADPSDEDPLTWVDRAEMTGDLRLARSLLDEWAADRPRDRDTLSELRYRLTGLGAFAEAAAVQRERLAFAESAWDRASAWQDLAALERQSGDHLAAWTALIECRHALRDVDDWTEVGLGRNYIEELFALAAAAGPPVSADAFVEAERNAPDFPDLPLVILQAATAAATNVGDPARAAHYAELAAAEQRRIDAL